MAISFDDGDCHVGLSPPRNDKLLFGPIEPLIPTFFHAKTTRMSSGWFIYSAEIAVGIAGKGQTDGDR